MHFSRKYILTKNRAESLMDTNGDSLKVHNLFTVTNDKHFAL